MSHKTAGLRPMMVLSVGPVNKPLAVFKAKSHCSENENDNGHNPKKTHSVGTIGPSSFNQSRACIGNIFVVDLVIEACVTGPLPQI